MLSLVVATLPEARPLISHFGLTPKGGTGGFHLFGNNECRLVVTGIGKLAAAAGCTYLQTNADISGAWLNVGIAGHNCATIGSPLLAHKVVDQATRRSFYPAFATTPACPTTTLFTVDRFETIYSQEGAFDMEMSGVADATGRFATAELIHSLKIISDNPNHPSNNLRPGQATALIESQLYLIEAIAGQLQTLSILLSCRCQSPPYFDVFVNRWHFTTNQRQQLHKLLWHWNSLTAARKPPEPTINRRDPAAEILHLLRRELTALPLELCSTSSI